MQRIMSYDEWCGLSDEDRRKEYLNWNAYIQEGLDILKKTITALKNKYKDKQGIIEITNGLYHGGLWVINITLSKDKRIKVPKTFMGFPIMKSYR